MWALLALWLTSEAHAERRFIPEVGARSPVANAEELALARSGAAPWSARVNEGAAQLGLTREFVHYCKEGLELLYKRQYKDTRAYFVELAQEFPGTGISPVADILVWQAMMLENYDFRYDAQYKAASAKARAELDVATATPGNDGWEQFLLAGVVGLEAIHAARQGRYLPALTQAFEAIDHVEASRAKAPTFVDLQLADGLYNYWRTVLTESSSLLPDFGDHKAEGIEQMRAVEARGVFVAPAATLSLAFAWVEEKRYEDALASCLKNQKKYPNNLINEMMTGIVYLKLKRYDAALATFDHGLRIDSGNTRLHYYRGVSLYRLQQYDPARQELEYYLSLDNVDEEMRGYAHWRLGEVYRGLGRYADAEIQLKAAVKLTGGNSEVKGSLSSLYAERDAGAITW